MGGVDGAQINNDVATARVQLDVDVPAQNSEKSVNNGIAGEVGAVQLLCLAHPVRYAMGRYHYMSVIPGPILINCRAGQKPRF